MGLYINPASDFFIRYLWGSEKNKNLTLSFINGVMQDSQFTPLVSLVIKNPFNLKSFEDDKESVLDIKAADEQGRSYNIEVQTGGPGYFRHRSLYYWARLYAEQLQGGELYKTLSPVICINILDFILFKEIGSIHSCFLLREQTNPEYILTDQLMLHFIELPKFKKKTSQLDPKLEHWLYFLRNAGKEEDETMKFLLKDDADIKKAYDEYNYFSRDDRMKEVYEARWKRKLDEASALHEAEQKGKLEGKLEGRLEGRLEGKIEVIIDMHEAGDSVARIAKITKMTTDEVIRILKERGVWKTGE